MGNRVFITGRGIISPIGRNLRENEASLRCGKSGVRFCKDYADLELDSKVAGIADAVPNSPLIDRKTLRFCPPVGVMSLEAVTEALAEAGLTPEDVRGKRIAIVGGVSNGNLRETVEAYLAYAPKHKIRYVSPYIVPRVMPSSAVAIISLILGLTGESYDVSCACASSAASIMLAARLIRSGDYDMVLAGGAEQIDWVQALGFCAIRALSTHYNDTPERASRPFDRNRDGFVLASGASYVLLESEKSIQSRGARPISEISGFYSNSNATDMVVPDAEACTTVMRGAVADAGLNVEDIAYINTHGTSTGVGDPVEMAAIRNVFGSHLAINSTKSQTGHMVGATGAAEVIFSSLMLERHFLSPSINIEELDPEFEWADLVRECRNGTDCRHALSNSFAFGGSNVAIVISDCGNGSAR